MNPQLVFDINALAVTVACGRHDHADIFFRVALDTVRGRGGNSEGSSADDK